MPNIPGLPKSKEATGPATSQQEPVTKEEDEHTTIAAEEKAASEEASAEEAEAKPTPAPAPKSWADLVKRNAKPQTSSGVPNISNGQPIANGVPLPKSASLADALKQYNVQSDITLPFLEPRGLVNTGNMCYMNSVSIGSRCVKRRVLTVLDTASLGILRAILQLPGSSAPTNRPFDEERYPSC